MTNGTIHIYPIDRTPGTGPPEGELRARQEYRRFMVCLRNGLFVCIPFWALVAWAVLT